MADVRGKSRNESNVRGLLGRFWFGQLPLPVAFWGFYVFLPLLIFLVGYTVGYVLASRGNPAGIFLASRFLSALALYRLIASIGVWRSAETFTGNSRWSIAAKAVVIIGGLQAVYYLLEQV